MNQFGLPTSLVSEILGFWDTRAVITKFRLVSKSWKLASQNAAAWKHSHIKVKIDDEKQNDSVDIKSLLGLKSIHVEYKSDETKLAALIQTLKPSLVHIDIVSSEDRIRLELILKSYKRLQSFKFICFQYPLNQELCTLLNQNQSIQTLELHCKINKAQVALLAKSLPGLRSLCIRGTFFLDRNTFARVLNHCPNLKTLEFSGAFIEAKGDDEEQIDGGPVDYETQIRLPLHFNLQKLGCSLYLLDDDLGDNCVNLTSLNLWFGTEAYVSQQFWSRLPHLTSLGLAGGEKNIHMLLPRNFHSLCPKMRSLSLDLNQPTPHIFDVIREQLSSTLEHLDLMFSSSWPVWDADIKSFTNLCLSLDKLKTLELTNPNTDVVISLLAQGVFPLLSNISLFVYNLHIPRNEIKEICLRRKIELKIIDFLM